MPSAAMGDYFDQVSSDRARPTQLAAGAEAGIRNGRLRPAGPRRGDIAAAALLHLALIALFQAQESGGTPPAPRPETIEVVWVPRLPPTAPLPEATAVTTPSPTELAAAQPPPAPPAADRPPAVAPVAAPDAIESAPSAPAAATGEPPAPPPETRPRGADAAVAAAVRHSPSAAAVAAPAPDAALPAPAARTAVPAGDLLAAAAAPTVTAAPAPPLVANTQPSQEAPPAPAPPEPAHAVTADLIGAAATAPPPLSVPAAPAARAEAPAAALPPVATAPETPSAAAVAAANRPADTADAEIVPLAAQPVPAAPPAHTVRPVEPARRVTVAQDARPAVPAASAPAAAMPQPAAMPLPPGPTPEAALRPQRPFAETRDDVAAVLDGIDCARVSAALPDGSGILQLAGHVPSAASRAALLDRLGRIPGIATVQADGLVLLPRPHCDTLQTLEALGIPVSQDQVQDLGALGDPTQIGTLRFTLGQSVSFSLKAPDFPAHLYVDYYDAAGRVLHLMPNEIATEHRFAPAEPFRIGGPGGLDLRVAPPFGLDLVVAVAASRPLFRTRRPMQESASDYLRDLAAAIRDAGTKDGFRSELAYLFILTSP